MMNIPECNTCIQNILMEMYFKVVINKQDTEGWKSSYSTFHGSFCFLFLFLFFFAHIVYTMLSYLDVILW